MSTQAYEARWVKATPATITHAPITQPHMYLSHHHTCTYSYHTLHMYHHINMYHHTITHAPITPSYMHPSHMHPSTCTPTHVSYTHSPLHTCTPNTCIPTHMHPYTHAPLHTFTPTHRDDAQHKILALKEKSDKEETQCNTELKVESTSAPTPFLFHTLYTSHTSHILPHPHPLLTPSHTHRS